MAEKALIVVCWSNSGRSKNFAFWNSQSWFVFLGKWRVTTAV